MHYLFYTAPIQKQKRRWIWPLVGSRGGSLLLVFCELALAWLPHWFPPFGTLWAGSGALRSRIGSLILVLCLALGSQFPLLCGLALAIGSRRGFLLLVLCALALALGCRIGSLPLVLSRRRWVFFSLVLQKTVVRL